MSDQTLYDDDILLWSEQQAELIRRLGQTRRDLPNDFDVENVAEEIESVGRSELAAVESYLQLVLLHLIKIVVELGSESVRHWRSEIAGFHANARRRYAPSMRQRIDLDEIWRAAREQAILGYGEETARAAAELGADCPIALDDLVGERIDVFALAERVGESGTAASD
jgi:hypothetical protein